MRTVAVIPARGGSKGVPGKNLRRVGGVTLVERAVRACRAAQHIDQVYVSTDNADIAYTAEMAGAEAIIRPVALAGDTATSESALRHALEQLEQLGATPEVLVFVQATSPFIDPVTLDRGVEMVVAGEADTCFAALPTHEFLWRSATDDDRLLVTGQNHDHRFRPRRQDVRPDFRETGAFYVMSIPGFREHHHRFFGRIAPVAVSAATAIDVDTAEDLVLANALAVVTDSPVADIDVDVVFTDFDGVHTDDTAGVDQRGQESVRVSRADGLGIQRLRAAGVPMVIVSKETNPVVSARAAKLRIEAFQGIDDKVRCVREWLERHHIPAARAAYVGNDINDAAPMNLVGWPIAVADARPEVVRLARLHLRCRGGGGAVRELCDLLVAQRSRSTGTAAWPERAAAAGSPQLAATGAAGS